MAVQDVQWELGSACVYTSSGETVTVRWGLGSAFVLHEYEVAAGGNAPTGHLYGPLVGSLGGPV